MARRKGGAAVGGIIGAVIVLILVTLLVLALLPRFGILSRFSQDLTEVSGVVGSEKADFFADPKVVDAFAKHGLSVSVSTAGSWAMPRDASLPEKDFAFPASEVAGRQIADTFGDAVLGTHTPFFSPIAIATFTPVLEVLEANDVASQTDGIWTIDMRAYIDIVAEDTRWSDLKDAEKFRSNRSVLVASTDIRSSNSAGMYMALASFVLNGNTVVSDRDKAAEQVDELSHLFIDQGYAQSSSAGPFERYLSRGAGEAPMVVVYEGQFMGEQLREGSRIQDSMKLAYPSPTVFSTHTGVTFSDGGEQVMQLLESDEELVRLLAEHGFRANGQHAGIFDQTVQEHDLGGTYLPASEFVDLAQLPSFEVMTYLLEEIGRKYDISGS